jgi:hypothetical protein
MIPGSYTLTLYKGDFAHYRFTLWQDLARVVPADLSSVVLVKAEIRDRPGGDLIVAMVCTLTQPNIIDMRLSTASSEKLPSSGVWDLQLTYASGDVSSPLAGPVAVTGDVTGTVPAEQVVVG